MNWIYYFFKCLLKVTQKDWAILSTPNNTEEAKNTPHQRNLYHSRFLRYLDSFGSMSLVREEHILFTNSHWYMVQVTRDHSDSQVSVLLTTAVLVLELINVEGVVSTVRAQVVTWPKIGCGWMCRAGQNSSSETGVYRLQEQWLQGLMMVHALRF